MYLSTIAHQHRMYKGKSMASPLIKFQVRLANFMSTIGKTKDTELPRKSNTETLLASAYMWDFIAAYAKGRSDVAWAELEDNNIIDTKELEPGEYILVESPGFVCKANVTQKVKRFNPETLAKTLNKSQYKVPTPVALQMIEAAKVPTTSQTKLNIIER